MGINIAQGIKNYHFILNIYLIYSRLIGQLPVDFRLTSGWGMIGWACGK